MPIDPGIAHLVKILNDAGFETLGSCQGGQGHPMIGGPGPHSYGDAFVSIKGVEEDTRENIILVVKSAGYRGFTVSDRQSVDPLNEEFGFYIIRFKGEVHGPQTG